MSSKPSIIVVGGLNTDIITLGVDRLLKAGELTFGSGMKIAPGGKSRNMAQMIAMLAQPGTVGMIGLTSRDPFNLWKVPYNALVECGVNVDHIKIQNYEDSGKFPGVALIPVDAEGNNQIYVLPGINSDFGPADIDDATEMFEAASTQNGLLALSLEMPLETAKHAIKKAKKHGLKVALDPGGIRDISSKVEYEEYIELLSLGIDLIKPNEHEMKILTRVDIVDFHSAELATHLFRKLGIQNTVVTAGAQGAYLFTSTLRKHIPVPDVQIENCIHDETGCGDQSMAVICTLLQSGKSIEEAVEQAMLAGKIQFCRAGVNPVKKQELEHYAQAIA